MGEDGGGAKEGINDKDDPAGNRVGLLCCALRCVALLRLDSLRFALLRFASSCCASLRFASLHLVVVTSLLGSVLTYQARPRPDPTPTRPGVYQNILSDFSYCDFFA